MALGNTGNSWLGFRYFKFEMSDIKYLHFTVPLLKSHNVSHSVFTVKMQVMEIIDSGQDLKRGILTITSRLLYLDFILKKIINLISDTISVKRRSFQYDVILR